MSNFHDEDLLEQLFWQFDEHRKRSGEERLTFKSKLRFYASKMNAQLITDLQQTENSNAER